MAIFGLLFVSNLRAEEGRTPKEIIRWLFQNAQALEDISFAELAEAASGKKVIPMDLTDKTDQLILRHVEDASRLVLERLNAPDSPTKGLRRINEASKHVEDMLVKLLETGDFTCSFPKNAKGDGQRSGYPDLELLHKPTGRVIYIDPKLFEASARGSTLRTFYFEPREKTLKITKDARHLLLGISHDGKDGAWTFLQFDVVDVSRLKVRLKAEFDASNKELYQKENIIGTGDKTKASSP
jgi:hypothetical protein